MDPEELERLKRLNDQELECKKNLEKVEKMLKKDGLNITHENFEEGVNKAFGAPTIEEEQEAKPGWVSLLPAYYAFEWVVSALKARFGTPDADELPQTDIAQVGELSSAADVSEAA